MSALLLPAVSYPWWASIGAPFANHLLQSTLFAAVAGLLTLLLKTNHANTRYCLWLLASVKFLIPFSVFVAIGRQFGWSNASATSSPEILLMMEGFGQPFASGRTNHHAVSATASLLAMATRALPAILLLVWLCGFVAVLFYWWSRARHMAAVTRNVKPAQSGREFDALRRVQSAAPTAHSVRLILSKSTLEPGILGIFRPILLLPAGISDRLSDPELEAILAHELCHVRRRDNLAAAVHMLVEAVFWFHLLVWWLGARLVDERERACDEEVLRLGSDPQTYAESILIICEFYLESPLLCAAGVTGSNLKKRIEVIMQHRTPRNLDFARKLLLTSTGILALAIPLALGLLHPTLTQAHSPNSGSTTSSFESVYLQLNTTGEPMAGFIVHGRPMQAVQFKVDRFMATNFSLGRLITLVYRVQDHQIVGGPDWLNTEKYDVEAKLNSAEVDKRQGLGNDQQVEEMRAMVQMLLEDRFKLAVHHETRRIPVYALVLAQVGQLQLAPAKPGDTYVDGAKDRATGRPLGPGTLLFPEVNSNKLVAQAIPIGLLVHWLAREQLDRVVVDKIGLTGLYDITLQLPAKSTNTWSEPALTEALEQQLGLKLEPQESPTEVLVVDSAEKPTPMAAVNPTPAPVQSNSSALTQNATKVVLAELKIESNIPDRDAVQARILNTWKNHEYADVKELTDDVMASGIRKDFQDRGCFKVIVDHSQFKVLGYDSEGRQQILLTASVTPGAQYRLGTFTIQNSKRNQPLSIPAETLREQFHMKTGDLFKVNEIRAGIEKSMDLYHAKGYADASPQPATTINEAQ
ncbi:MAG: TIGR03435 family protein, partial [Candidatus Acidiferrum sp.]